MLTSWFQKKADQAVREALDTILGEARESIELQIKGLLQGAVAVEDSELVAGPKGEHRLIDFETQQPETLSGLINFGQMQDGEAVRFDLDVRWSDGRLDPYWKGKEVAGLQEEPLYSIDPIVCPRGAVLKVRHVSGGPIPIKYYFVRRRP